MPDKPPLPFRRVTTPQHDPLVQKTAGSKAIPSPIVSFDGMGDRNSIFAADPTMDVSPTQILDWKNKSYQVLDKTGILLAGPFDGTAFWSSLGGACANSNIGDILVRWDQFANQWVVSQLASPGCPPTGYHQCVAVSQTSDATGAYYQYDYLYSTTDDNDYPKFGLWPDPADNGYYFTVRDFDYTGEFAGMKIIAIDRNSIPRRQPGNCSGLRCRSPRAVPRRPTTGGPAGSEYTTDPVAGNLHWLRQSGDRRLAVVGDPPVPDDGGLRESCQLHADPATGHLGSVVRSGSHWRAGGLTARNWNP
jgi:hypothetical protein